MEDISGIALLISLKRVFSFSARTHIISIDHLPENLARTFLIGQDSILVYFSKFSFNVKAFYDAPTVITFFAPKDWDYGVHDCTSMAITMTLAAWSLGIGSCYVSRAEETFDTEFGKKIMEEAGISKDYVARVHLCLGYPKDITNHAKPRKEGRIHVLK